MAATEQTVILSRAQLDKVKAALDGVRSNGQAIAAVDSTLAMAAKAAEVLRSEGASTTSGLLKGVGTALGFGSWLGDIGSGAGPLRESAAKSIVDMSKPVRDLRKSLGSPSYPVGKTWQDGKAKVHALWILVLMTEKQMPPGVDLGDNWADAIRYGVDELPNTISKAVAVATKTAVAVIKPVVGAAADVVGGVSLGLIGGLWPILLIVGAGAVAYVALKGKVAKAVAP